MPPFRLLPRRAPVAVRHPVVDIRHGIERIDEFAWLRAANWQQVIEDPEALPDEIHAYLVAENAYAARAFRPLGGLTRQLAAEMRGRMEEDEASPPLRDGPFLYAERFRKGQQYPVHCRQKLGGKRWHILVDGHEEAKQCEYFDFGAVIPSPDHRLLAWSADMTGAESYTIRIRDLATGVDLERLERSSGDIVWGRDGSYLLYGGLDAAQRPDRVMRHVLGTPQSEDVELHREEASGHFVDLGSTQDDRFGLIAIGDHESNEVRLIDLADPASQPVPVFPRLAGIDYEIEHHEGRLIVRTNLGAEDFCILALPLGESDLTKAETLVPETQGRIISSLGVLADWLVWSDLGEAGPLVHVRHWRDGRERTFGPRAAVGDIWAEIGLEFQSRTLRLGFSSPVDPEVIVDVDLETGAESEIKRQIVPSGHDPARYITRRLHAGAPDGERVPVTLLARADTPLDGTSPALLYAYGAYGDALEADFWTDRLSLVDRGFVYCLAHVRGGLEKGKAWYKAAKFENKSTTFSDFIAVADFLVAERICAPGRIVAEGISAGGMLMGAVANQAGEKFAGIIANVPFVDCLNTMLDDTLPLTRAEWMEWGNPAADPAIFSAMLAYSPYDTIAAKPYPPMLVIGGLTDPRVTYWEPAKFVAKLRATMTGGGPILFITEMGAGHGGASGRFEALKMTARIQAFALECVGLAGMEGEA